MICNSVNCKKNGRKLGKFGKIDLVYCGRHKSVYNNFVKRIRQAYKHLTILERREIYR